MEYFFSQYYITPSIQVDLPSNSQKVAKGKQDRKFDRLDKYDQWLQKTWG